MIQGLGIHFSFVEKETKKRNDALKKKIFGKLPQRRLKNIVVCHRGDSIGKPQ